MFKDKELEKRVSEIEDVLTDPKEGNIGSELDYLDARIDKIEEQLKPEPTLETGDIVKFLLIGNEFEGEIISKCYDNPFNKESQKWYVKYLDKNNVSQTVVVNEEDIWVEIDDCITDIYDQIEELSFRLKALENKKK